MLRSEQDAIDERTPEQLPPDEESPFDSPWVFGRARQEALLDLFFRNLQTGSPLVFFYTKDGNPLGDRSTDSSSASERSPRCSRTPRSTRAMAPDSYPMWDRLFTHSIRPDGSNGFLLPYHDYLAPTGDEDEDARRLELLREIAVAPDRTNIRTFSYVSELATPDVALSTLVQCLESVRRIREHGIAAGPWELREEWLNQQIAKAWQDRGAFPGLGAALEALGLRLGTALVLELSSKGAWKLEDDPWDLVDAILRGDHDPPQPAYGADIAAIRNTWVRLPDERRDLLKLLSRFDLSLEEARRWFDGKRSGVDARVVDAGRRDRSQPVSHRRDGPRERRRAVDRYGYDRPRAAPRRVDRRAPPSSGAVRGSGSPNDVRRVRAAIVSVLRQSASERRRSGLDVRGARSARRSRLARPITVGSDWIDAEHEELMEVVDRVPVEVAGRNA